MTTTILAPIDLSTPKQVGPRTFRKQILRKARINYPTSDGKSQEIAFDDAYIADLAAAYNAGAYDDVPFILADEQNRHTMAPERWRGWVKAVEVTPDGLDAIIELSADAAELVVATGGKLGVSPRIKPVKHVDGRTFPKAINHVLGTLDQRQQGDKLRLRPWEPVDLADPTDDVLDLTGAPYTEGSIMPDLIDLSALTDEQQEILASFAAANSIDLSAAAVEVEATTTNPEPDPGEDPTPSDPDHQESGPPEVDPDDDGEGLTDAEIDALIEAELAEVQLSAPDDAASTVDLAAGLVGTASDEARTATTEAARLRFELAARDYRDAGVPPHLIDLAAPILSLSDDDAATIDLSSPATGEPIDVRGIVRDMLDTVKGTIDLSAEAGYGHDGGESEEVDATAKAWLDYVNDN